MVGVAFIMSVIYLKWEKVKVTYVEGGAPSFTSQLRALISYHQRDFSSQDGFLRGLGLNASRRFDARTVIG
jgi:hypothetical protein